MITIPYRHAREKRIRPPGRRTSTIVWGLPEKDVAKRDIELPTDQALILNSGYQTQVILVAIGSRSVLYRPAPDSQAERIFGADAVLWANHSDVLLLDDRPRVELSKEWIESYIGNNVVQPISRFRPR